MSGNYNVVPVPCSLSGSCTSKQERGMLWLIFYLKNGNLLFLKLTCLYTLSKTLQSRYILIISF